MNIQVQKNNLIGVVGPCSAGKSTLIGRLTKLGYSCRHIAQEHSYVPDMWKRLVDPIALIYLDVSYPISMNRRPLNLSQKEFEVQKNRLSHAFQNADLNIHTDELMPDEVQNQVVNFLREHNIYPLA
jgi:ABC-type cobalamin/Fe3+-siderophores transport system ATPase subunit